MLFVKGKYPFRDLTEMLYLSENVMPQQSRGFHQMTEAFQAHHNTGWKRARLPRSFQNFYGHDP